ncbi:HesB/IscA family protein [Rubeoparvulum massiliense]|uniref:HesB/IscA family protein n=1 Tax=Rubeoparvulum massiliense TaxID=1631346 RepID=UPI00065E6F36|nr:iron-sulfur cluster assembly accessory protein [Rubeoparvulum massiliense]
MIHITEHAIEKIKEMMHAEENHEQLHLRVAVQPGGCSGYSYGMGFEDQVHPNDTRIDLNGLSVLIDDASAPLLKGVEIDYKESLMGGGFTIHNPNAVSSCGCGSSFRTANDAGQPGQC